MRVQIADMCIDGPEKRMIGYVKMTIKEEILLEFDKEQEKIIEGMLEIIGNNPYCEIEEIKEIKINGIKTSMEEINEKIEKSNKLEIKMTKEAIDYYRGCIFYLVMENYPEDYFLDKEFDRW